MVSNKFLGVAAAKFTTFAAATLVAVGITACGSQPDCDDGDVKDVLTQIAKE